MTIISSIHKFLEREIEKQEKLIAEYDGKIEAAAADYQELTRLLGEKEEAELLTERFFLFRPKLQLLQQLQVR